MLVGKKPLATKTSVYSETTLTKRISAKTAATSPLRETKLSPVARVEYMLKLDVFDKTSREELLGFIVSSNPFEDQLLGAQAHSVEVLWYEKEQALRIAAIRKLTKDLAIDQLQKSVQFIKSHSEDEALTDIAQLALMARLKGEDYFTNMISGIKTIGVLDE